MTEKRQTSQGYIILILQHFATNFVIKISLKRGKVYYTITESQLLL